MKLFSLDALAKKAGETFMRFPLILFSAIAGTMTMIQLVSESYEGSAREFLGKLGMACYLSMLFTLCVTLYMERFTFRGAKKHITELVSLFIIVLYYFSLPKELDDISGMRFALFILGLHLLVSFSPFLVAGEQNGLWQFNKSIFIRILTSALYSGVLFAGLALAMLAVDKLFDINIKEKYYADLWIVIAGIFNTWFFLSGVPENIPSLNDREDYPKGLKIFTVYVLIPLITVYMVILYLYAGKILITANWPVGWVGYMVIAFAIFGILSFLLIYPLRDDESHPWVKFYSRLFYFLLIVPIILLFTAIFKRINQYGITEDRYFVIVLAFWLSFIVLYFILTNGKNIRIIPLSLCVTAFLTSFGPWGAFNVSHNSQFNQLTALLDSNHVLLNGKADTTKAHEVNSKDYERIDNIVRYLNRVHGHVQLQNYFSQNLDSLIAADEKNNSSSLGENNLILGLLKMEKMESDDDNSSTLYYRIKDKPMLSSAGYDFVKDFNIYSRDEDYELDFFAETDTVHFSLSAETGRITLTAKNCEPLVLEMKEMFSALPASDEEKISQDKLTIETDNRQWKVKIIFNSLSLSREDGRRKLDNANGMLMLRINSKEENEVGEKGTH